MTAARRCFDKLSMTFIRMQIDSEKELKKITKKYRILWHYNVAL